MNKKLTDAQKQAVQTVLEDPKAAQAVFESCYVPATAAPRLRISGRYAQHLCAQGKMGFKVGKRYYITEAEIQAFERERAPSA